MEIFQNIKYISSHNSVLVNCENETKINIIEAFLILRKESTHLFICENNAILLYYLIFILC